MHNFVRILTCLACSSTAVALLVVDVGEAAESVQLESRFGAGDVRHVETELVVGGELSVVDGGEVTALKMSVVGRMAYDERRLEDGGARAANARAVRHYGAAEATIKIEDTASKPILRPERQLIGVAVDGPQVVLYSPAGTLTRDELDLIDLPGNSLLVDALLPGREVKIGESWRHDAELLGKLLRLDAVSAAEVKSVLTGVAEGRAAIEMSGRVDGAVGGVASEIELKARYAFDLSAKHVTSLTLLIKEQRSVGHVAPGLDVVARLEMNFESIDSSDALSDAALKGLDLEPSEPLTRLSRESVASNFRFEHDRRWHIMSDDAHTVVLRLVDRGDLVAQCNVHALPAKQPGQHPSLSEFQEDIQKALDSHFGQFIRAAKTTSPQGYLMYRVEVAGIASELPIRWLYYMLADGAGHRATLVFTAEADLIERLGTAGSEIVTSLEFVDHEPQQAARPTVAPTQQ